MKRRFLTSVLLSLVLAVSIFSGSLSTALAEGGLEKITVNDFNETAWEQNLSNFESTMTFVSEKKNYETTVETKTSYNDSYSVTFKFATDTTGMSSYDPLQRVVALGAKQSEEVCIDLTDAYGGTKHDDTLYIGFSANKVYIFDRSVSFYQDLNNFGTNLIGGQYWKCFYDFYTSKGATLHAANIKLEVVKGENSDVLNFYSSKSADALPTTPDKVITLHKQGVANGYVQFSQAKFGGASASINNVKINDTLIKKSELNVLGREDLVTIDNSYPTNAITLYDANASDEYVLSNFSVYEYGVAEGEVFDLTIKAKRFATPDTSHNWGLVLGVDDSGDLSTGKQIIFAENGVRADTNGGRCVKHCDSNPVALTSFTYTIKGYVGGRVEVSYNDYSTCSGHTAVYNDIDFNGKIAFKIFSDSKLSGGYWNVSTIAFNGNASYVDIGFKIIGASVKTTGTQGLKFAAQISEEGKAILAGLGEEIKYGILLINDEGKFLNIPCDKWYNETETVYTAVLKDLLPEHANEQFTAKAYVQIDGKVYFTEELTRSIAQVADLAINDYKVEKQGEYEFELEAGKFYRVNYSTNTLDYLKSWADYYIAE